MRQWLRLLPLLVILILLLGPVAFRLVNNTARAMNPHWSSCLRRTIASLCPAESSAPPDELEEDHKPVSLPPTVLRPFTGHMMVEGQAVPRLRSRVWHETPLQNPLLLSTLTERQLPY